MSAAPAPPSMPRAPSSSPTPGPAAGPPSPNWHWASALAGALAAAILLGGAMFLWERPDPPPIVLHPPPTATPVSLPSPTPTAAPLVIYVSGAVAAPGLYELPPGARVGHALEAAGGLLPEADGAAVNLATLLVDGGQVHVPTIDESAGAPPAGLSADTRSAESIPASTPGPINLNTAGAAELESLPGIGPAKAEAIIANRPYSSIDDLDRVPGIGPATIEQLRPLVTVQ